jgi:hypothetical protein
VPVRSARRAANVARPASVIRPATSSSATFATLTALHVLVGFRRVNRML